MCYGFLTFPRQPTACRTFALPLIVCVALLVIRIPSVPAGEGDQAVAPDQVVTDTIDRLIREGYTAAGVEPAPRCDNRTFARRVFLDLAGRIPTPAELNEWIEGDAGGDRDQLIDSLLASEDYVEHFADLFDAFLMGRAGEDKYQQRDQHQWRDYLEQVFRQNRPWNQVIEEVLLARPGDDKGNGAVWFLYERNNDYQKIAEAIAPAVFGVRIECAQCHDHMMADEIKQAHYWGLVAFFNRSKNENQEGRLRIDESAIGGFSEFADITGGSTPNYLTFLDAEQVDEPRPEKPDEQKDTDELYLASTSAQSGRVPKFSRREKFVDEIVRDHPRVARALVNRVWAILMGRGIVHPFDEMDSMHRPSHPELLDWLAEDFRANGYDIRRLVRGIVRSEAYHLNSGRPQGVEDPATFAWYLERPLTGEQMARSLSVAVHGSRSGEQPSIAFLRQQFPDVLPKDHVSTVKDALFLSNSAEFDRLLQSADASDHLMPRVLALPTRQQQTDLLFTTIYGRLPDAEERSAVVAYLEARPDEPADAVRQVVWSMLTSAEFRFNH